MGLVKSLFGAATKNVVMFAAIALYAMVVMPAAMGLVAKVRDRR